MSGSNQKNESNVIHFARCVSVLLGLILIWAGLQKMQNLQLFLSGVLQYRLLPRVVVVPFAMLLPAFEITLGVFLVILRPTRMAFFFSAVLFATFVFAQLTVILRGLNIACNCFGSYSKAEQIGTGSIARTGMLMSVALLGGLLCEIAHHRDHEKAKQLRR